MNASVSPWTDRLNGRLGRVVRTFLVVLLVLPLLGACQTVQEVGDIRAPRGYVSFCDRHPGECSEQPLQPRRLALTAESFREIADVNAEVNKGVRYVSDRIQFGVLDRWDLPAGRGDCEDIALEKRRRLIGLGYPRQALLLALAKTARGNGHLVLVIATDRGDFVLDNLTDDVAPRWALSYSWIAQQSSEQDTRWVALRSFDLSARRMSATPRL